MDKKLCKKVIEEYIKHPNIINSLYLKMASGDCNDYDRWLYSTLVEELNKKNSEKDKKYSYEPINV